MGTRFTTRELCKKQFGIDPDEVSELLVIKMQTVEYSY